MAGVPERVIARQTGHTSMAIPRRYIREGSLFRENAAARVGLSVLEHAGRSTFGCSQR